MSDGFFEAPTVEHLGELLPAYRLESLIATGGMGAVYKAVQRSLDREVAIKILPREFGGDPQFIASFETEAKAMARLNHPNLIGVYDYGEVEGMPYIAMEYVNGQSLFHVAFNQKMTPMQAVSIVKGICDGLAHAHENGVIHRDIKPANILLTQRGVPKIGDFGLARHVGGDDSGLVMGTPGYIAREVMKFPEKADRRSDLFALGVILYELLIGKTPPYEDTPPPSTLCGCDVALDRICAKAMNQLAELRYQSAEQMSGALDAWLRKLAAASSPAAGPAAPPAKKAAQEKKKAKPAPAVAAAPAPAPEARRMAAPPSVATPASQPSSSSSSSGGAIKGLLMLVAAVALGAFGWWKYAGGLGLHGKSPDSSVQTAGDAPAKPTAPEPGTPDAGSTTPAAASAPAPLTGPAKQLSGKVARVDEMERSGSLYRYILVKEGSDFKWAAYEVARNEPGLEMDELKKLVGKNVRITGPVHDRGDGRGTVLEIGDRKKIELRP